MGTTGVLSNIPYISYIQKTVPQKHLGKVLSLVTSVMSFAAPIGMFVAGPVAEMIGVGNWMKYAGIAMIVVGIYSCISTRKFDNKTINEVEINEE